jgi:hypothetical protein
MAASRGGSHFVEIEMLRGKYRGYAKLLACSGLITGMALLGAAQANAASFTYNVDVVQGADSITGTITTDKLGFLANGDLTGWNLEVNNGNGAGAVNLLGPGVGQNSVNTELYSNLLEATNTQLLFLFDSNSAYGLFEIWTYSYSPCPNCTFFDLYALGTGSGYITVYVNPPPGGNLQPYGPGSLIPYTGTDVIGTTAATPLPATAWLLFGGLAGLGFFAYRGTKKNFAAIAAA